jgi:SAM-dependent methyltransferase
MASTEPGGYVFDQTWEQERSRLAGLEAALDPGTIRHLEALGIDDGWRCLEVGAGGGSVARWLCGRVGRNGHVLATDLELHFFGGSELPNLEVRRHDILTDELPPAHFDLIHLRWVLHWLPAPQEALARLVTALRPGGWLLAEEPDFVTLYHASAPDTFRQVATAAPRLVEAMSRMDTEYGRRLFGDLCRQGLTEVSGEGRMPLLRGGQHPSAAEFLRLTIEKVRAPLAAGGVVTDEQIAQVLTLLQDPGFATVFPLTIAVWGRRPIAAGSGIRKPKDEK